MNHKQLKELAKKGAFVRWSPSGAVELLRWSANGSIQAVNVVTKMEHMIVRQRDYSCVELQPDEYITAGSLLPVRSKLKRKPHLSPIFKGR